MTEQVKEPAFSNPIEAVVSAANLGKGDVFYLDRGFINPSKCHVVEVVELGMIVFKWHSKHKQRWVYEVIDPFILDLHLNAKAH